MGTIREMVWKWCQASFCFSHQSDHKNSSTPDGASEQRPPADTVNAPYPATRFPPDNAHKSQSSFLPPTQAAQLWPSWSWTTARQQQQRSGSETVSRATPHEREALLTSDSKDCRHGGREGVSRLPRWSSILSFLQQTKKKINLIGIPISSPPSILMQTSFSILRLL